MMGGKSIHTPYLFSFVTLREEEEGGIAFNPYLGLEVYLNDIEFFIATLLNDLRTFDEVVEILTEDQGILRVEGRELVDRTSDKLRQAFMLGTKETLPRTNLDCATRTQLTHHAAPAPKSVIWDVTNECNLHCCHCLSNSGRPLEQELNTRQCKKLIDILSAAKVLYLSISGGEPFLRPDIIDILNHATSTGMRVDIATNGTAISDDILCSIRELPIFQIQVSIDGTKDYHDRFRGMNGAFNAAYNALERIREEAISTSISMCVTSQNISDLDAVIDLAIGCRCVAMKALPFLPQGRGKNHASELRLTSADLRRFARTMTERKKELQGKMNIVTETCMAFLLEPPPPKEVSEGPMGCSAGHDIISIGADGTVYPCPFFKSFALGNIMDTPIEQIWFNSPTLTKLRNITKNQLSEPCHSCDYAPSMCQGGCRAAAYLEHGDIFAHDPCCFRNE